MTNEQIPTESEHPPAADVAERLRSRLSVSAVMRCGLVLVLVALGMASVSLLFDQWRVAKAMRIGNAACGGMSHGGCSVWTWPYLGALCESVGYDRGRPPVWWPRYIRGVTIHDHPADEWFSVLEAAPLLEDLEVYGVKLTDAQIAQIGQLRNLTELELIYAGVNGSNLKSLRELQRVTKFSLSSGIVDDAGIDHICQMRSLRELYLGNSCMSDRGLRTLGNSGLQLVDLTISCDLQQTLVNAGYPEEVVAELTEEHRQYVITDDGLLELAKLTSLESLSSPPDDAFVTQAGLQRLRMALPKCRINGRQWSTGE